MVGGGGAGRYRKHLPRCPGGFPPPHTGGSRGGGAAHRQPGPAVSGGGVAADDQPHYPLSFRPHPGRGLCAVCRRDFPGRGARHRQHGDRRAAVGGAALWHPPPRGGKGAPAGDRAPPRELGHRSGRDMPRHCRHRACAPGYAGAVSGAPQSGGARAGARHPRQPAECDADRAAGLSGHAAGAGRRLAGADRLRWPPGRGAHFRRALAGDAHRNRAPGGDPGWLRAPGRYRPCADRG